MWVRWVAGGCGGGGGFWVFGLGGSRGWGFVLAFFCFVFFFFFLEDLGFKKYIFFATWHTFGSHVAQL